VIADLLRRRPELKGGRLTSDDLQDIYKDGSEEEEGKKESSAQERPGKSRNTPPADD
jgi:hypothetical protein